MKKRSVIFFRLALLAALAGCSVRHTATPCERAMDFITNETQFHLGDLITEQSHPNTRGLSQALQADTAQGIRMLLSVDDDIPPVARRVAASPEFAQLRGDIKDALDNGKRIYFSGCGATGRLAILLDTAHRHFWRDALEKRPALRGGFGGMAERTRAVMTGGDYALVRSVEKFEDYITFGYHQMEQAGLAEGDVLVAISEGGETSSVIGTILRGVDAKAKVYFLFNNPPDLLADKLDRCRSVIRNPAVTAIPLCTGPMAIAGSTRMQATTTEMLIAGMAFEAALLDHLKARLPPDDFAALCGGALSSAATLDAFDALLAQLRTPANVAALARLADYEEGIYTRRGRVTYFADGYLLDIFTDNTERAPSFMVPPFRRAADTNAPAPWAFVKDPLRPSAAAWLNLLAHEPNCLDWTTETYLRLGAPADISGNPPRISRADLLSFAIGNEPDPSRTEARPNAAIALLVGPEHTLFAPCAAWRKAYLDATPAFDARAALVIGPVAPEGWDGTLIYINVETPQTPLNLFGHLAFKLAMNNTSTATMGKMGRFTSNWMLCELANKKLIDRSTRLVTELAGVDYTTACIALFETMDEMKAWDETRKKTTSPAAYTVKRLKERSSKVREF